MSSVDELCQKLRVDIQRQIIEVDSLRTELDGLRDTYVESARDFVDAENTLLELMIEAAIPDIPDNLLNIREYLKKILMAAGKMMLLSDISDAWHARREARRNMEGAKNFYDDGMVKLEIATGRLSTLSREHQKTCG